jgi:hypothetical protein
MTIRANTNPRMRATGSIDLFSKRYLTVQISANTHFPSFDQISHKANHWIHNIFDTIPACRSVFVYSYFTNRPHTSLPSSWITELSRSHRSIRNAALSPRLKSLKSSNSSTLNPNATWSISLESYHPYLQPQTVSKNPQTHCIHSTLPKNTKAHFGCLGPLGIKLTDTVLTFLDILGFLRFFLRSSQRTSFVFSYKKL